MTGEPEPEVVREAAWTEGEAAGWSAALEWFRTIVVAELAAIDLYADTRPLESLRGQVEDRIRAVSGGGNGG